MTSTILTHLTAAVAQPHLASLARSCRRAAAVGAAGWVMLGCATAQESANASDQNRVLAEPGQAVNTLNEAERAAGWRLLFDGTSLNGWRAYQGDSIPPAWRVVNGSITKNVTTRDIVTLDQFGDFDLIFEWKVATGGNSGLFYRATEEYNRVYWSATEYQLLDDPNAPDGRNRLTAAGAAYGLYPAPEGVVKPAGEWNSSRVLAVGPFVEHWLNGRKIVAYTQWSPDWLAKVQASKFRDYPNYGRAERGHIALQGDHRGDLELRNIKIRAIR